MEGWHWSVVTDEETGYESPGVRLFSNEDGSYRVATDDDVSYFDRNHQSFVGIDVVGDPDRSSVIDHGTWEKFQVFLASQTKEGE